MGGEDGVAACGLALGWGRGWLPDLAVGVFHVGSSGRALLGLGGQVLAVAGGSATRLNSRVHASCQGHASGRCRVIRRAEEATRAGTVTSLRRIVAVVDLASAGAGHGGGGAGEVERDDGQHEPGRVRGELPGWQVRQGRVLQVGVDLFDDRVPAVGLVGGDGVQLLGGDGGEEGVEAPHVEQGALPVRLLALGVEVGDAAHDEPARDLVGWLLARRTR